MTNKTTPTGRMVRLNIGQMMHQTRHAERMQIEAVKAALAAGHVVIHDEIILDEVPQRMDGCADFMCGRCGKGFNFGEAHKCK